jgi:predicted dehydrogenase
MDMGIHCIDLLQYISGTKATAVTGFAHTQTFSYNADDSSAIVMKMDNGALAMVDACFNIPDEAAKWRIELFGDEGRLIGENVIGQVDGGTLDAMFCGKPGAYDAQQDIKTGEKAEIKVEFGDAYTREIESFGNSILNNLPLEVPATDAVQVQRVMEAAYRSNDEKTVITL